MDAEKRGEISRRTALKRMATGAAIAWSAPILTSLRTPAFATNGSPVCASCEGPLCSGAIPVCGQGADGFACICVETVRGDCACINNFDACGLGDECSSDAGCPSDWRCFLDQCCASPAVGLCGPPCGVARRR